MLKLKAVIATVAVDKSGKHFTEACLREAASEMNKGSFIHRLGSSVPIGHILHAYFEKGRLIVDGIFEPHIQREEFQGLGFAISATKEKYSLKDFNTLGKHKNLKTVKELKEPAAVVVPAGSIDDPHLFSQVWHDALETPFDWNG